MKLKGITTEDFVNYKEPSLFIALGSCDYKCCKEANIDTSICQNSHLAKATELNISNEAIYDEYIKNPITKAIVIGGLEPMTKINDILDLLWTFRKKYDCHDPFIIYTGYYPNEIKKHLTELKEYDKIIMKFGRFIPNHKPHYDEVLGINLVSDNQYGEIIS